MRKERAGLAVLSGLGDPVRRRLYEFVSGRTEPVTRDEAADAAGIGRPLAAYHLDKLVRLGLLTASYQRPPGRGGPGAGRPAKVYLRSAGEFAVTVPPREYELAARLLAEAVEADADGASQAALRAAARRFGAGLGLRSRASAGAGAGTGTAAQALEMALREHGFEPAEDADGTVRLRNCPFHQLAAGHPDVVCGMNLALIEGLIDGLRANGLRAALEPGQGRCCVIVEDSQRRSGTTRSGTSRTGAA
ncbi:MAG TPA: helix-turn-helix domain-containing protein [Streptosporangiaceae bacterium]|nr:helix-turn-helix domain-containing protein [Streptosporangiaceae bacterium]